MLLISLVLTRNKFIISYLPLAALQAHHMREIQRLMGCLLFADRPAADTPYADLLSPTHWEEVAQEFPRQACSVMGQVRRQAWQGRSLLQVL